jgi:diaminopimelate epimerase
MKIPFIKMHAFGNDFAIFDCRKENQDLLLSSNDVIILADRNFGIGCDQVIVIYESATPSDEKSLCVMTRIYNTDGSEAQQCGNGMRCIAAYVLENEKQNLIKIQIGDKTVIAKYERDKKIVKVNMGIPVVMGEMVDIGNKHKVIVVDNFDNIDKTINNEFNINYVKINSKTEIFVRTIERGVGETLSCGSGVCASVAYCITQNLTEKIVKVITRGSDIMSSSLEVAWEGSGKPMLQAGSFTNVFEGEIEI